MNEPTREASDAFHVKINLLNKVSQEHEVDKLRDKIGESLAKKKTYSQSVEDSGIDRMPLESICCNHEVGMPIIYSIHAENVSVIQLPH